MDSKELKIKQMNCLSNIQHELLKTFYDGRPVTERYLDGSIAIHAHIITSENSLCVTWVKGQSNGMFNSRKGLVFVRIGEVTDKFSPVTSLIRLQHLKHCNVLWNQTIKTPQITPEFLWRIYNDELCLFFDTLGVKAYQLISQIFKGLSQGLYDFPDEPACLERGWAINGEASSSNRNKQMATIDFDEPSLILQGDTIGYFFSESVNLRLESIQVFPCPINLFVSAIQRVHMLYYPYGEESGKETEQCKVIVPHIAGEENGDIMLLGCGDLIIPTRAIVKIKLLKAEKNLSKRGD